MNTRKNLMGLQDARSNRGIFARGTAHYGVSRAPRPGNIFNVQKAAQARLKKMRKFERRKA